jgi:hypothetical protein
MSSPKRFHYSWHSSGVENRLSRAHILGMPHQSKFYPKTTKDGRWTVRMWRDFPSEPEIIRPISALALLTTD